MRIGSRGSMMTGNASHIRQNSNQKQRSFSNDARIMLHESKKLEQRFAQNQQAIQSLDNSLVLKHHNSQKMKADPNSVGQGLYSSGFNEVAEFKIYEMKFKQASGGQSPKRQRDLDLGE